MMMFPVKNRRLRNLLKQGDRCLWCNCKVVYFVPKRHEKLPDNFATIDHLNDKIGGKSRNVGLPSKKIGKRHIWCVTTVLACKKCNEDRANKVVRSLPKEVLRKLSGDVEKNWAEYEKKQNLRLSSQGV